MSWVSGLLYHPVFYSSLQSLLYKSGQQKRYVDDFVKPRSGDKILDLGCGVGYQAQLFQNVDYTGLDSNPLYIQYAQKYYSKFGKFKLVDLNIKSDTPENTYDIVMANGVLHHLDDQEALQLIKSAHRYLKPGGRFVTRDGFFEDGQNWVSKFLLNQDRGRFVRTIPQYDQLISQRFSKKRHEKVVDAMWLPYPLVIYDCQK